MGKSKGSNYKPSNKAKQRAEKAKDRKVEKVEGSVSVKSPKSKTPSKSPKKESSKSPIKSPVKSPKKLGGAALASHLARIEREKNGTPSPMRVSKSPKKSPVRVAASSVTEATEVKKGGSCSIM